MRDFTVSLFRLGLLLSLVQLSCPLFAAGSVTTDGTLGAALTLPGPNYAITQALGTTVGTNLFHSFGQFNIGTGETATFSGAASISNIIARVTGGASSIDGTLASSIAGANLYLVNPSGISFGPNATLNVSGSFYATTADYLKLGSNGRFDATTPSNSVLTAAAPSAFGFLGPTPAAITVTGSQLQVPIGQTLGLVGGDITIGSGATLSTESGGAVALISAASAGEASMGATPAFDVSSFTTLGTVSITGSSVIDVSEATGQTTGAGTIYIRGGNFVLDGSTFFANTTTGNSGGVDVSVSEDLTLSNGALISTKSEVSSTGRAGDITMVAGGTLSISGWSTLLSETSGSGNAGDIHLVAGALTVDSADIISDTNDVGNAGAIMIDAGTFSMSGSATIDSSGSGLYTGSNSLGKGGDITINVTGAMSMDFSRIKSEGFGDGDAGRIRVSAGALALTDEAEINSTSGDGLGRGGDIIITTPGMMSMDYSSILSKGFGSGDAGKIQISAGSLALTNSAEINSTGYFVGRGGDIAINVAGAMSLSDGSALISRTRGDGDGGNIHIVAAALTVDSSDIKSGTFYTGTSGAITIDTGTFALSNGSTIDSSGSDLTTGSNLIGKGADVNINVTGAMSMDDSIITSKAYGDGDAGNVRIQAGTLSMTNSAQINSTAGDFFVLGRGGDIVINVAGAMTMDGFSKITSQAPSDSDAGRVQVSAGALALTNGAEINDSAGSGSGRGGDIAVTVAGGMSLDTASNIISRAYGDGDAGAINLQAGTINITDSAISTDTLGAGNGGPITLNAATINLAGGSISAAASPGSSGNAGSINITTTSDLNLNSGNIVAFSALTTSTEGAGRGGDINLQVGRLNMGSNGNTITALTATAGDAGNVNITATTSVSIQNSAGSLLSGIFTDTANGAPGNGGNVTVAAPTVTLEGNAVPGPDLSLGLGGSWISADTSGVGHAGNLNLQVASLNLINGGRLSSQTFGSGDAGTINVSAAQGVVVSGTGSLIATSTVDNPVTNAVTTGAGGAINISTGSLSVSNGGLISANTSGSGTGGSINLSGGNIALSSGGGITASSTGSGAGGSIIANESTITLNGAQISANSAGTGNAGSITLNSTDSLQLLGGSKISSSAANADGGDIRINARTLVYLQNSQITTSVGTGQGNGGNISIDPTFVVLQSSQIIADAFGGNGGNINIVADNFFKSPDSIVSASSQLGISGAVTITSPIVDVTTGLVTLPTQYLDASSLLAERCAARLAGKASSFVMAGRGGMPLEPDGLLPSSGSMQLPALAAGFGGPGGAPMLQIASINNLGCSK